MDLSSIPKTTPIEPFIECDGGCYTECRRCYKEIYLHNSVCPHCKQAQDWSWLGKYKHKEDE